MTQENGGTHRKDAKAMWIMLAVLLVLTGFVVWMLVSRSEQPPQTKSAVLLDSTKLHANADLGMLYTNVNNGDTWQELTDIAGWPGDCLREVATASGLQQICMWYSENASVVVTLLNNRVVSKTKVGF